MASQTTDRYLEDLSAQLGDLPAAQRRELLDEIRNHIGDALAETPSPTEADTRNVLDRLGEPSEIAREARERFGIDQAAPTWHDWLAVVLLPIGGLVIPLLGWFVGLALLWASRVWTTKDKLIGTFLFPFGLALAYLLLNLPVRTCTTTTGEGGVVDTCASGSSPVMGMVLLAVLVIVPIGTAIYLARKLVKKRAAIAS